MMLGMESTPKHRRHESTAGGKSRYTPLVDNSLNAFDEDGMQTVFAIAPFGNSETRQERLDRWEAMGIYDPDCRACDEKRDHPTLSPFAPSHKALSSCRSGGRNHCTCDSCF